MAGIWVSEVACVDLLGAEKAQAFINQFGGTCMYVPVKPSKDHIISQAVGIIGMAALCREYAGCVLDVANARQKESKKARIMDLLDQGMAQARIASLVEVSERYVRMVKKECGQAS